MGDGGRIPWGRLILGLTFGLAIAAVLVVLLGPLVAAKLTGGSSFRVRDDSMAPTLIGGDWVLAEKIHPGATPERGAIVVYEDPASRWGQERIGRLVGLPGERVQMRGGALYIDGARAEMEPLGERVIAKRPPAPRAPLPACLNEPVEIHGDCRQELWRETLPDGTAMRIINARNKLGVARLSGGESPDNTGIVRVPKGHVFVLGDNRDQALDSRDPQHGTVPLENLRARVWMVHTSLDRSGRFPVPRWDRFFMELE